jgi:uncharacterized membrane protein YedE/YeeE
MQPGYLNQAISLVGIILIALGIFALAYFTSPVRYMLRAFMPPHKPNLVPPILGGLAFVIGVALLYATRTRD